jgi:hypothetical protein
VCSSDLYRQKLLLDETNQAPEMYYDPIFGVKSTLDEVSGGYVHRPAQEYGMDGGRHSLERLIGGNQ